MTWSPPEVLTDHQKGVISIQAGREDELVLSFEGKLVPTSTTETEALGWVGARGEKAYFG